MEIALLMGSNGDRLKTSMVQYKSDLTIESYNSVSEFIDKSYKLNRFYDRVLILSNQIHGETDLTSLKQFREQFCPDTSMVVICRKGTDSTLAKVVDKTFASQQVTSVLLDRTTMTSIIECAILEIGTLKSKYGIIENLDNLLEEDEVEVGVNLNPDNADKDTSNEKPVEEPKKSKKGGLFGGLFGKKKQEDKSKGKPAKPTNTKKVLDKAVDTVQSIADDVNAQGGLDSINLPTDGEGSSSSEFTFEPVGETSTQEISPKKQFENFTSEPEVKPTEEKVEDQVEENSIFEDSVPQEKENDGIEENTSSQGQSIEEKTVVENEEGRVNDDASQQNFTFNDVESQKSEFNYQDVSVDFSSMDMGSVSDAGKDTSDINENLGSISGIAQAENEYRQAAEQPKVVTKVVTREIIRDTGKKALIALENVQQGLTHRAVVVTGDRGSGVTTTALTIAKSLVNKGIKVLYLDLDNENHGLLNYIDVKLLYDYGDSVIKGTKLLNKSELVHNAVMKYDDNIDMLTSDFSTDVSANELESTIEAVTGAMEEYGVVIVDCPIKNLHLVSDMMLLGNTVLCTEATKRGIMNMLCQCELSTLPVKYKKKIVAYGLLFLEHKPKNTDIKKLMSYFSSVYAPSENGANWIKMKPVAYTGKVSDDILNTLLEG